MKSVLLPFGRVKIWHLLVWLIVVLLGTAFFLPMTAIFTNEASLDDYVYSSLYLYGLVALWAVVVGWRHRVDWRQLYRWPTSWDLPWGKILAAVVFSWSITGLAFSLFLLLAPSYILETSELEPLEKTLAGAIVLAVIAPVVEELIFRGVLLGRWAHRSGVRAAIIFSSLIFAVGHVEALGSFVFGLLAGLMYWQTRSLFLPTLLHVLNNALVAALLFAFPASEPTLPTADEIQIMGQSGVVISAVVALVLWPTVFRLWRAWWPSE